MKKGVLLVSILPFLLMAATRPKNTLVELATGTWCGYCPDAYAGLEVMKGQYPASDLVCIRYYNNSGNLSNAEADARDDYYAVSGYPTCVFNGLSSVVGGGSNVSSGSSYAPIVSSQLSEGSPFWVTVDLNTSGGQATVTANVELYEDYNGAAPKVWIALIEDAISGEVTNAVRRVVDAGEVSITGSGQNENFEEIFDIDAGWTEGNLQGVAFLQINSTKEILQSGSSYPVPDYHYRNTAPVRIGRISPTGTYSGSFYLTNVGANADDYEVTIDDSALPSGWSATLIAPATHAQVSLDPGDGVEFELEVEPNGNTGYADVIVDITPVNGPAKEVEFRVMTNDIDYNLVDDDGDEDFEGYFTAALDAIGATYGVWDVGMGEFNLNNLAEDRTPVLIWSCGWSFPSLTVNDQALLKSYLSGGGKLFLTGQDIGWDLCDANSGNYSWETKAFYNDFIHANYVNDDANNTSISGVVGDPITDGLSFNIAGGDGENNQEYPSVIEPFDETGNTILTYSTEDGAAIRAESGIHKVVYLAFGFEGIDNAADRESLLENALDWLGPASSTGIEGSSPGLPAISLEVSPVISGILTVNYSMPLSQGTISVFDALGRKIEIIKLTKMNDNVRFNLSSHPTGCYFVYLESDGVKAMAKTVLLR